MLIIRSLLGYPPARPPANTLKPAASPSADVAGREAARDYRPAVRLQANAWYQWSVALDRLSPVPRADSPAYFPQRFLCAFSVVVEELDHRSSVLHHGPHLLRAPSPPQVEVRAQARYAAPQGDPPVVDDAAKREAARRHTDKDRHAAAARRKDDRLDVLYGVGVVTGGHDAELVVQAYEEECLMWLQRGGATVCA